MKFTISDAELKGIKADKLALILIPKVWGEISTLKHGVFDERVLEFQPTNAAEMRIAFKIISKYLK